MTNPTAAVLLIGDEILSGRTQDSNLHFLAGELMKYGIDLNEARVIRDKTSAIIEVVRTLSQTHDYLFTSGGIGPTHDDITAEAIAAAFDLSIDIREDARSLLVEHYQRSGRELNIARLRMARIPDGASLIYNSISAAPGFSIENVHVMAGVPVIFRAMVADLLPRLNCGRPVCDQTLKIMRAEGDIAAALASIADEFKDLSIGCYPFRKKRLFGTNVVVRGANTSRVSDAIKRINAALEI
ncbi:MAG: competence/damage-inducible protein A [Aestuariivita sp.]|nr:competence/damage-inducible protein A [Aestuariivita sp.]